MQFYDPARIGALLDERAADGILVAGPPNVRYLTGFPKEGGTLGIVLRDALTRPILIVPSGDLDFILEDVGETTAVHVYGEFVRNVNGEQALDERESLIACLHEGSQRNHDRDRCAASTLQQHGLDSAILLTDIDVGQLAGLQRHLPSLRLQPDALTLRRLRMIKTDEEIRRLSDVACLTEAAIIATIGQAAEGMSQADLARGFHMELAARGARLRLDNVSLGRSSAFGNANVPGDLLAAGKVIRFDVGAVKGGYASDIARCYGFRSAETRARRYYAALYAGQQAALAALRPGAEAREVFEIAVRTVRRAGLPHYQRTHVGHGIGLHGDGIDLPLLAPGDATVLEAGMVLCVETPYYEIGFGGLQVEDMVVVTPGEPTLLTMSPSELPVLP